MKYKSSETDWQKSWYSDYQGEVVVQIDGAECRTPAKGVRTDGAELPAEGSVISVGIEA